MKWNDLADTKAFAVRFAQHIKPGEVIRLDGALGAGKTTFVQYFAEAWGSDAEVTSPTFSIVRTYDAPAGPIHHLDFYRIEDPIELEQIEYEDYFFPEDGVSFLEWATRVEDYLPTDVIRLEIDRLQDDVREVTIAKDSQRGRELAEQMEEA